MVFDQNKPKSLDENARNRAAAEPVPPLTYAFNVQSLDAHIAAKLRPELAVWSRSGSDVVLDMAQITFIDSAGLGFLKSLLLSLSRQGRDLRLRGLQTQPKQLLTMVRLGHLIKG